MADWRSISLALALPLLAVAGVAGAELWSAPKEPMPMPAEARLPRPGYGAANYDQALAAREARLDYSREIVANKPDDWLPRQVLARALVSEYRITGDFSALDEAGALYREAGELAPAGSGPALSRAEWAMMVHDLPVTAAALDLFDAAAVKLSAGQRSTAAALRGDIRFYQGDLEGALADYGAASEIEANPGTLGRMAILERARGNFDAAIACLVEAAVTDSLRTPETLANLAMQIGTIESGRGNYNAARSWFRQADDLFPGNWKAAMYLAEATAVTGDLHAAADMLESVAARTEDPQVLDGLAHLYRRLGSRERSRYWSDLAAQGWADRLVTLPLASLAHAAEHELAFGDPARALALARRNLAARQYGEARLLLGRALLANGKPHEAKAQLLIAQEQGWRSAPLFLDLANAHAALGENGAAEQARADALALNPRILSPEAARIWFAHG